VVVGILVAGCGDQNYGGTATLSPAESQASIQKQIDEIQKNDHMPAQAKAAAIGNLKSRMQNASIAGKGMNGPGK